MPRRTALALWTFVSAAASPSSPSVQQLVLQLLCDEQSPAYDAVPIYPGRNGVGGLFSQLNYLAQEVFSRLYRGYRPFPGWHANTRLRGYGSQSLDAFFHAIPCGRRRWDTETTVSRRDALRALAEAPRHLVVSHVLAALYRPRMARKDVDASVHAEATTPLEGSSTTTIDLAMHVRRGDRLYVERQSERIREWSEDDIVLTARKRVRQNGTILVASDDSAFSRQVATRLRTSGYLVLRHHNDMERLDAQNRSIEAALVCGASCVPPLLSLVQLFSRARALMLSSKSNLGSFLLSWWFAANADQVPELFDLDGIVNEKVLSGQHRYFCELPWGSRRGLCKSNQTACELSYMAQRSFCRGSGSGHSRSRSRNV